MKTALTRVFPALGRARDQKQKETEERAASIRSGPPGRGHGTGRRWCAAARPSWTRSRPVESRAQLHRDTRNPGLAEGTVDRQSRTRYGSPCASLTSLPLRRVWELGWPPPAPPLRLRVAGGGGVAVGGGAKGATRSLGGAEDPSC